MNQKRIEIIKEVVEKINAEKEEAEQALNFDGDSATSENYNDDD